jgi:hypothetical protein
VYFQHIFSESPNISLESPKRAETLEKYLETPEVTDRFILSVVIFQFRLFTPLDRFTSFLNT